MPGHRKTFFGPKVSQTPPRPRRGKRSKYVPGEGGSPLPTDQIITLGDQNYRRWSDGSLRKTEDKNDKIIKT
jgi:hypothetical protein